VIVNLIGNGFELFDFSSKVRIGSTNADAFAWHSDSSLSSKAPGSSDYRVQLIFSLERTAVNADPSVAYFGPIPINTSAACLPTSGHTMVSIFGKGFVHSSGSQDVLIGATVCSTIWASDTNIVCMSSPGVGVGLNIRIKTHSQEKSLTMAISYVAPTLVSLNATQQMPSSGSVSLTLVGLSFKKSQNDGVVSTKVGLSICRSTFWTSDSSVVGIPSISSSGIMHSGISLTTAAQVAHLSNITRLFAIFATNSSSVFCAPSSGSNAIMVIAKGTSKMDMTLRISLGRTSSEATRWLSDSSSISRSCAVGHIFKTGIILSFQNDAQFLNVSSALSIDVSSNNAFNDTLSLSGSHAVNIAGHFFGSLGVSFRVSLQNTITESTFWISGSALSCKLPLHAAASRFMKASFAGISSNLLEQSSALYLFSFHVSTNISTMPLFPATGSVRFFLTGKSFGTFGSCHSIKIGGTPSPQTTWVSDSSMLSRSFPSSPMQTNATIQVSMVSLGSAYSVVNFLISRITHISPQNGPLTGSILVNIAGSNFGLFEISPKTKFGGVDAWPTIWTSDSSVKSLVPVSAGISNVTISYGLSDLLYSDSKFQYDTFSGGMDFVNSPCSGSVGFTIVGLGFQKASIVRVGLSACDSTTWFADTGIFCKPHYGSSKFNEVIVTQFGTLSFIANVKGGTHVHGFDAVTPVSQNLTNQPSSGSRAVFALTKGNSLNDCSMKLRISFTNSEMTKWISDSSVNFKHMQAQSSSYHSLSMVVTTSLRTGSLTDVMSYDKPQIAIKNTNNGPSSGCVSVTVAGQGLGSRGYSSKVSVGRGSGSEGDVTGGTACALPL